MNKKKAKLNYKQNFFEIIEDGDYVLCAVSGKEIKFHSIENGGHNLNAPNDPLFFHRIWDFLKRF